METCNDDTFPRAGWRTDTLLHHGRSTLFQLTVETRRFLTGESEGGPAPDADLAPYEREQSRTRRVAALADELASLAVEIRQRVAG